MSPATKCDGCGMAAPGSDPPKDWLRANVRNGHGTKFAVGDFHSADCLAMHLASDKLDRAIKKGSA